MADFLQEARALRETLVAHRRTLHQNPVVGSELPQTVAYVAGKLREMGYAPEEICPGGLVAYVGREGGKTFLLRADMDALPMREDSGVPFASCNDYAHTCGHDLHTAMLLGAAQLLKDHEAELPGRVKLMFQPDEENIKGARAMVKAGVLDGVDAAMALHVAPGDLHAGTITGAPGPVMASSDVFEVAIAGVGGHGASPQKTVDPINVAAHIHLALQEIVAREADPQEPLVVTVGMLRAGDATNIIPHTALMQGTIRAFAPEVRALAKKRLVEICEATAALFRASCKVSFLSETMPTVNDDGLYQTLLPMVTRLGLEMGTFERQMGSEDFAYVADGVPAVFWMLGAGGEDEMYHRGGGHNPMVVFNEDALPWGAAAYAQCAVGWLEQA